MKIKFSPQGHRNQRIRYQYFEEMIKSEIYQLIENEENKEEIIETLYTDLSSVVNGKIYIVNMPLSSVRRDEDGELLVELVNYIGEDATHEENFPVVFIAEEEEFEIPEDAEVVIPEEFVVPEPEANPLDKLTDENFELRNRINNLQNSMMKSQRETEDLIVTLMMML